MGTFEFGMANALSNRLTRHDACWEASRYTVVTPTCKGVTR